jgi:tetraacyldisaccharide 4'-kinase
VPRSVDLAAWVEGVWYGDGVGARLGRAMLAPASWGYLRVARHRGERAAAAAMAGGVPAIPALSIGNLTVGGTGKTPVASWAVSRLQGAGASPAILLRGYGDDEWRVHQQLTPGVPVLTGADRRASAQVAEARGCDCVVMDDAFQHRQAPRVADWVLVSADRWPAAVRVLPQGPFREPLTALQRASAVVITTKAAGAGAVEVVRSAVGMVAPDVPVAVLHLRLDGVRHAGGCVPAVAGVPSLTSLGSVLAVSAIGNPEAFERQLEAAGVVIRHRERFRDHHTFRDGEVDRLVQMGRGCDGVVCTLKDAVKLAPRWPATAVPLWYVSQTVQVVSGREGLDGDIARLLAARPAAVPTAG